ncbi:dihydrolipoamide acetyltransferase family protein [Streptomyces spectabilis]|uniref:Dihydrolipoamide acetyltransferase component of pyruvate dehydrogenase complex n=1 Tax=Streptomyces spectabilis TaxID=68270 RepID=A0A516R2Z2_STRST|nr:dihydrolipoamide acetyltransferase family protein [Streptomyces spectabilis]QDQ10028.1 2-oxo acid dehydrogenase subunit E2 [Streptomyces spectabilis]
MAHLLRMPEVAAGTTEAVLRAWPLAPGSAFAPGDVLATVETDKAAVDIEAETDGVLLRRLVAEGAVVRVGAAMAVLGAPGETDTGRPPEESTEPRPGPDGSAGLPPRPSGPGHTPPAASASPRVFGSPLARRLAREAGLAHEDVPGTGPGGRVVRGDVLAAIARRGRPAAPPADGLVPHTRARRASAARLVESKRSAPHFYLRGSARAGELLALRRRLTALDGTPRVSLNDLFVRAAAQAHRAVPALNVRWSEDGVRTYDTVDVAIAVATERGLVTPVLRDADRLPLRALAAATADLTARARAGELRQAELEGGTLTLTNLGMYGTEEFAAIVNPPQTAILALGAARPEAVVVDGEVRAEPVVRATLSVDHRPVDGVVAARWMREFTALLEEPLRLLL